MEKRKEFRYILYTLLFIGLTLPHLNFFSHTSSIYIQSIPKIIVLIIAFLGVFHWIFSSFFSVKLNKYELALIILALYIVILDMWSPYSGHIESFAPKLTFVLIYYFSLKFFLIFTKYNPKKVFRFFLVSVLFIEAVHISAQGVGLLINGNHLFKIGGSSGHPGFTSMLMGLLILFMFSNYKYFVRSKLWRGIFWGCFTFCLGFSIYSLSRVGILLCLGSLFVLLPPIPKYSWKTIGILVFVCFLFGSLYMIKTDSSNGRVLIWKTSFELIQQMPIFGHGTDSFESVYNEQQAKYFANSLGNENEQRLSDYVLLAYNDFIELTLETGLLGLFLLLQFFLRVLMSNMGINVSGLKLSPFIMGFLFTMCFWSIYKEIPYLLMFFSILAMANYKNAGEGSVIVLKYKTPIKFLVISSVFLLIYYSANNAYNTIQFKKNSRLAQQAMTSRNYQSAIHYYEKALSFFGSHETVIDYTIALDHNGDSSKAIKYLNGILKTRHSPNYSLLLGDLYFNERLFMEAENHYLKAYHSVPSKFTPLYKLSKTYISLNNKVKADSISKVLLENNPKVNSAAVIEMKEEIRYRLSKMRTKKSE